MSRHWIRTRSVYRKSLGSRGLTSDAVGSGDEEESALQSQLKTFIASVTKLEQEAKDLREQNKTLEKELDTHREKEGPTTPRKRASSMNIETKMKMQKWEERVKELEKKNARLQKKIQKLREKELKAEADELKEDMAVEELVEQDGVHVMRKILRKFDDLMTITTLGENEDCPICFERLQCNKCSGFPCQHIICNGCLPQISRGYDETVQCPQCRSRCSRDEVEVITYTETERFDMLLKLASKWATIDCRGDDTSEEEAEEEFIDDGETVHTEGAESEGGPVDRENSDEEDASVTPSPKPDHAPSPSYAESPTREKRKRLEELAQTRSLKRIRCL